MHARISFVLTTANCSALIATVNVKAGGKGGRGR
jgi:hypothetical protein